MHNTALQLVYRRKCLLYSILSTIIISVAIIFSGCTDLLTGDNKIAYDLIIKASQHFKYPSSVRIVSGIVTYDGDSLFCVISAKNSYGTYRTNSYCILEDGYPFEYYSKFCYEKKGIDYDLINNAIAAYYGESNSYYSILINNIMGGKKMKSEDTFVIYSIVLIVLLCLNGELARNASDIAHDKGYRKWKWFHMCFWLGPISYIIIAAMPDLIMRKEQRKTNKLIKRIIEVYDRTSESLDNDQIEEDEEEE